MTETLKKRKPSDVQKESSGQTQGGDWSVEQLADMAGTTVRNLRAFQDRGVISPPDKRGRHAVYGAHHLYRLRMVLRLQERGYSLNSIQELIGAAESGRNVRDLIGLDAAITQPLASSSPATVTQAQLLKMFSLKSVPRTLLARAIDLGFLTPDGARYRAGNIHLLEAAAELVRSGIRLPDLLDVAEHLRTNMQRTADDVLWRLAKAVDTYGTSIPPAADMPRIADLINKLRGMVDTVILAEAHRAIENSVAQLYGDRLARTLDKVSHEKP